MTSMVAANPEASEGLPETGSARAAILLLTLGPEGAGRLLRHLPADDIRQLRDSVAGLSSVSPEAVEDLVEAFREAFEKAPGVEGPALRMNELLESALEPDALRSVMGDEAGEDAGEEPVLALWEAMEGVEAEETAVTLAAEHPHVVAIFLSKVSADTGARITRQFEPEFRHDVMRRMLEVRPLARPVQRLFETHVRQACLGESENPTQSGRHAVLADIVNRLDKSASDDLLDAIESEEPHDAGILRRMLFAFEDVEKLSEKARLVLFDSVEADTVIQALRGCDEGVREAALGALGGRTRRMVEAELAREEEVDPEAVDGARRRIAAEALRLAGEGTLQLPTEDAK